MDIPDYRASDTNPVEGDLPRIGQVIKTASYQYEITGYLGEGLTSIAYEASMIRLSDAKPAGHAALKVLRPHMDELSIENYWGEAAILRELRDAGIVCVPEVYDVSRETQYPFIAMQLVSEEEEYYRLDRMLERNILLSEEEVLEIAEIGLEMLDLLHTKVQRSYTDMQIKNFFWNREKKQLVIIDWNHVSYKFDMIRYGIEQQIPDVLQQLRARGATSDNQGQAIVDLVTLDLQRFASYLYTLLTGGKTAPDKGATVWLLDELGGERWKQVSQVTGQLVFSMLVSVSGKGAFETAANFLKAIQYARKFLKRTDVDELRNEVGAILDKFKDTDAKKLEQMQPELQKAIRYVDHLKRLSVSTENASLKRAVERYENRLHELRLTISEKWAVGQRYFNIADYQEALKHWRPEAVRIGKIHLFRWVLVAEGAAELGKQDYDQVAEDITGMLEKLEQADLPATLVLLDAWEKKLKKLPNALALLKMEVGTACRMREFNGQPDPQKMLADLRSLLQQAEIDWEKLPYAESITTACHDGLWAGAWDFAKPFLEPSEPQQLLPVLKAVLPELESRMVTGEELARKAQELADQVLADMAKNWPARPESDNRDKIIGFLDLLFFYKQDALVEIAQRLLHNPADPVVHETAAKYRSQETQPKTPEQAVRQGSFWRVLNRLSNQDYSVDIQRALVNYYDLMFKRAIALRQLENADEYGNKLVFLDRNKRPDITSALDLAYWEEFKDALFNNQWDIAHQYSNRVLQINGEMRRKEVINIYAKAFEQALREKKWGLAQDISSWLINLDKTIQPKLAEKYMMDFKNALQTAQWEDAKKIARYITILDSSRHRDMANLCLDEVKNAYDKEDWLLANDLLDDLLYLIIDRVTIQNYQKFQDIRRELMMLLDQHLNLANNNKEIIERDKNQIECLVRFDIHYNKSFNFCKIFKKLEFAS